MTKQKNTSGEPTSRRERAAAELRSRQSKERARVRVIWGAVGLVILFLVGFAAYGIRENNEKARFTGLDAVKSYEVEAAHVTTPVTYEQSPPVGGPHNPVWLNCGVYETTIPSENAVHSMEHGAVWITYQPELAADDIEKLKATMPPSYGILTPFEGLKAPVVASAWGKQLVLDDAGDPRLGKFVTAYAQSVDAPEPGASCTGASDGTYPLDAAEQMQ